VTQGPPSGWQLGPVVASDEPEVVGPDVESVGESVAEPEDVSAIPPVVELVEVVDAPEVVEVVDESVSAAVVDVPPSDALVPSASPEDSTSRAGSKRSGHPATATSTPSTVTCLEKQSRPVSKRLIPTPGISS
jgi:hypothetical protein